MVYCQIKKFYQNHRYYVKSKNNESFNGKDINKNVESDDCKQVITKEEMGITTNLKGENLTDFDVAVPCGLIAKSFLRD